MFLRSLLQSTVLLIFLMLVSPALAQQGSNNTGTNDIGNNNVGNNDVGNNNIGNNDIGNNNVGNNDVGNNNIGNNDIGNNNIGNKYVGDNNVGDNVPEIDPGSAVGALALLTSGMLLLTDKRRCKAKLA